MIKGVKLLTGEEIVADVTVDENSKMLSMKNPLTVILQPTPTGEMTIRFFPFAPYAENHTVSLSVEKTVYVIDVDEGLKNQYNTIFGAGIMTPPPKKIIL